MNQTETTLHGLLTLELFHTNGKKSGAKQKKGRKMEGEREGEKGEEQTELTRSTLQNSQRHHAATQNQVLHWPSQCPDLNPIENLWSQLMRAVHKRKPKKIS
ncbi:hypothetical protein NFI96_015386 [Prochilodus magdalenae]|nr:hypothetical protein NFI96_015386 [Prochilodus magdalenae]